MCVSPRAYTDADRSDGPRSPWPMSVGELDRVLPPPHADASTTAGTREATARCIEFELRSRRQPCRDQAPEKALGTLFELEPESESGPMFGQSCELPS